MDQPTTSESEEEPRFDWVRKFGLPGKAKAKAERKSSKRKRSKSPDPETLREKNQLSKQEVLAIQNHDVAVNKGSNLVHYKTENEWKDALGKKINHMKIKWH